MARRAASRGAPADRGRGRVLRARERARPGTFGAPPSSVSARGTSVRRENAASPRSETAPDARPIAAVDLGSNSFHMVVAREDHGHVHVVDRLRERVALGAGLDDEGVLSEEIQDRALACLSRFGQRLRDLPPENVRVVGTNALRVAKNSREFTARAARALGHQVEVIRGREEARLIYLGVAHGEPDAGGKRLVVDIGGGSTEVIIGVGFEPLRADSLYMGCVSWTRRFFPGVRITRKSYRKARIAARLEVQSIARLFRSLGWEEALGASGTILAIEGVLREAGRATGGITAEGLEWLRDRALAAGRTDRLEIAGLEPERAEVLPGGLAILEALFEGLGLETMRAASGALREGVLYDLLGRIHHEDVRDRTIRGFARRHHADPEHAARVERTALALLASAARPWRLRGDGPEHLLAWAARVHEVGLSIAYTGHHKHGGYLVQNSDLPGFSRSDQGVLAAIVRCHRRKLDREAFDVLPAPLRDAALRLCLLLRLAVRLHHGRSSGRSPPARLVVRDARMSLRFPKGWLDRHPLTRADLLDEASELRRVGFDLKVL